MTPAEEDRLALLLAFLTVLAVVDFLCVLMLAAAMIAMAHR